MEHNKKIQDSFIPDEPRCLFYRLRRDRLRYVDTKIINGRLFDLYEYDGHRLYGFARNGKFPKWKCIAWNY